MKKLLSLALALVIAAALPLAVFAEDGPVITVSPADGGNPVCEIADDYGNEINIRVTFNPDEGYEVDFVAATGKIGSAFEEPLIYVDEFDGQPEYIEFTASKDYSEVTVVVLYKQSGDAPALRGDLDGDGEITVSDALIALRIAAKLADETEETIAIGDSDGDGHITVSDALAILRVAAKLADTL